MNWTIIYKEDYTDEAWAGMLNDLSLPDDTDEITAKAISYVTESGRVAGRKSVEVEDSNKHIKALCHDISYFFRETDLDIDCCGVEHIEYMIGQGYIEGDLTVTDPDNPEEVYHGYWSIVK